MEKRCSYLRQSYYSQFVESNHAPGDLQIILLGNYKIRCCEDNGQFLYCINDIFSLLKISKERRHDLFRYLKYKHQSRLYRFQDSQHVMGRSSDIVRLKYVRLKTRYLKQEGIKYSFLKRHIIKEMDKYINDL